MTRMFKYLITVHLLLESAVAPVSQLKGKKAKLTIYLYMCTYTDGVSTNLVCFKYTTQAHKLNH